METFHVAVAAEAFAAGLLAQAGCDVLVQYGANQPEYDLVATRAHAEMKVSVKGSQDGGWGLIQKYKKEDVSYHQAADRWAQAHRSTRIVYCLVQFKGVPFGHCPRAWLATIDEIAAWHKASRGGRGHTILWEHRTYAKGACAGTTDEIPESWRFTEQRLDALLSRLTPPALRSTPLTEHA
jgi:Holliday junction resolvase-like predicted endonuclease